MVVAADLRRGGSNIYLTGNYRVIKLACCGSAKLDLVGIDICSLTFEPLTSGSIERRR